MRVGYCFATFDGDGCSKPMARKTRKSVCCCTMGAGWGDPCELCPRQNTCEYQWGKDEISVFLIPHKLCQSIKTQKSSRHSWENFSDIANVSMCSFRPPTLVLKGLSAFIKSLGCYVRFVSGHKPKGYCAGTLIENCCY